MATEGICPGCGHPLPEDGLKGLCPECLIKAGFETGAAPGPNQPTGRAGFTPPSLPEIARLFPQFEIVGLLGLGGMGAVYKARQPALDRWVAIKVLPPQTASKPDFTERFNREARALARLTHPHIVALHEFGQAGGLPYFIMEFVDGVTLRQLVQSRKLSPEQALAIVPQICEALQFAHDEGVVHRDIKPENILLDKKGRVKIADFGIAKIVEGEVVTGRQPITQDQQVIGTPHYMAPEQVEKPHQVDHRADIYSLGVVFYEMLTGELPLGKFAPPSRKVQVDVRLDEVVLHALEKEPERRYQEASALKSDVETIATSHPPAERRGARLGQESAATPKASRALTEYSPWELTITFVGSVLFLVLVLLSPVFPGPFTLPLLVLSIIGLGICALTWAGLWPFPSPFFPEQNFSSRNLRRGRKGALVALAGMVLVAVPVASVLVYLSGQQAQKLPPTPGSSSSPADHSRWGAEVNRPAEGGSRAAEAPAVVRYETVPVTRGDLKMLIREAGKLKPRADEPEQWEVDVDLPETSVVHVKVDQEVECLTDAFPERSFKGRVARVSDSPNEGLDPPIYSAVIQVTNPGLQFRRGMSVRVSFLIAHRPNVLKVPVQALGFHPPGARVDPLHLPVGLSPSDLAGSDMSERARRTVWVLRGKDEPEPVSIRIGITDYAFTEVTSGLREGELVVIGEMTDTSETHSGRQAGSALRRLSGTNAAVLGAALGQSISPGVREASPAALESARRLAVVWPDGLNIELVALSEYPSEGGRSWRTDGGELSSPPLDESSFDIRSYAPPGTRPVELLFSITGLKSGPGSDARMDFSDAFWTGRKFKHGDWQRDIKGIALQVPANASAMHAAIVCSATDQLRMSWSLQTNLSLSDAESLLPSPLAEGERAAAFMYVSLVPGAVSSPEARALERAPLEHTGNGMVMTIYALNSGEAGRLLDTIASMIGSKGAAVRDARTDSIIVSAPKALQEDVARLLKGSGALQKSTPVVTEAGFSPVISRALDFDGRSPTAYLDLDTGQHLAAGFKFPFGVESTPAGIDLRSSPWESDSRARLAINMALKPVETNRWDASAAEVRKELAMAKRQAETRLVASEVPQIFFFRTSEGSQGILQYQLGPMADGWPQVRVRYKLLSLRVGNGLW